MSPNIDILLKRFLISNWLNSLLTSCSLINLDFFSAVHCTISQFQFLFALQAILLHLLIIPIDFILRFYVLVLYSAQSFYQILIIYLFQCHPADFCSVAFFQPQRILLLIIIKVNSS